MKTFHKKIVYLSLYGANQLFANEKLVGLPVIPFDDSNGFYRVFEVKTGQFIGGLVSPDFFVTIAPQNVSKIQEEFVAHIESFNKEFGPINLPYPNIDTTLISGQEFLG